MVPAISRQIYRKKPEFRADFTIRKPPFQSSSARPSCKTSVVLCRRGTEALFGFQFVPCFGPSKKKKKNYLKMLILILKGLGFASLATSAMCCALCILPCVCRLKASSSFPFYHFLRRSLLYELLILLSSSCRYYILQQYLPHRYEPNYWSRHFRCVSVSDSPFCSGDTIRKS